MSQRPSTHRDVSHLSESLSLAGKAFIAKSHLSVPGFAMSFPVAEASTDARSPSSDSLNCQAGTYSYFCCDNPNEPTVSEQIREEVVVLILPSYQLLRMLFVHLLHVSQEEVLTRIPMGLHLVYSPSRPILIRTVVLLAHQHSREHATLTGPIHLHSNGRMLPMTSRYSTSEIWRKELGRRRTH